jgi:signal transduction histidine kinase
MLIPPTKYCRFFIVLVTFWAFPFFSLAQTNPPLQVNNGLADLSQLNLQGTFVALDGQWAYYHQRLISPSDTTKPDGFIAYPKRWNELTWQGKTLSSQGYASYAATIVLPKNRIPLSLFLPDVYTSFQLYVNGKLFAANGKVATSKAESVPHWQNLIVPLPTNVDTLELLIQIANFSHSKGGPYKQILLGDSQYLTLNFNRNQAADLLLSGCLFMGGLFFFSLYLFGTRDRATFYFSLFSMMYSYRAIGSSGYVLHSIFPDLSWSITTRLEYVTLFLSIVFLVQYIRNLYPEDTHHQLLKWLTGLCLLFSAVTIVTPAVWFTQLINPFLVVMFFCIVYTLFVFAKAAKNKRVGSKYALISIGVLMLVFLLINLQYFGIIVPEKAIIFFGYIAFFFLQSLILSFRFAFVLKKAKAQAEEGLRAKTDFLSTMSHEIRTPLNSVIGMTHLLLQDKPRDDQKEQLDVLLFSGKNLLSIVNDILDFNKIEAGKISFEHIEMDVAAITKNIIKASDSAANEKGLVLKAEIDPNIDKKQIGDPTRLTQVLNNLVHNAIKFTAKGFVTVKIAVLEKQENNIRLKFSVADTGIGIAKEKQELIFDQFTQADSSTSRGYGGTGLGLAICKRILQLQGSALQLNSELGKGAEFYFELSLPLSTESTGVTNATSVPIAESEALKGVAILLVEDNMMNVLVAQTFLERWGALVDVAYDGQQAIEQFDATKHQLILMDMHMPVMDGYEATEILRKKGVTHPIIALTASLPKEIEAEVKQVGITDIVVKPFNPDELFEILVKYCPSKP